MADKAYVVTKTSPIAVSKKEHNDDFIDRLNYWTTVKIIAGFTSLLLTYNVVGQAIQCFIPAEYPKSWEKYLESYCFVENTYYVNSTLKQFPEFSVDRQRYELRYYQWMPYILLLSAFVAYIPKKVFNLFYKSSNYRETDIIESAWKKLKSAVVGETKADMPISSAIAEKLLLLRQTNTKMPITNYLTFIYFSMKILTICVNFVQLWILAISLRTSNIFWGWKLTRELFNGEDWRVNGFFPRVTFCDFQTRHLGQVRPHTVQCVLILNMFNEKIFLFLWFWFVFLILATFINLAWWFYRVFVTRRSIRMITDALQQTGLKDVDHDDVLEFIRRYLFYDGIVVLRLIDSNVGFISMANVCRQLWDDYYSKQL